jgi:hypothetical protein
VNWMRYFATELSQRGVVRLGLRVQQSASSDASVSTHSTTATSASDNGASSSSQSEINSSSSNSSSNVSNSSDSLSSSSSQLQSAKQLRYNKRQEQKRSTPRTPGQLLELETQHKILVSATYILIVRLFLCHSM